LGRFIQTDPTLTVQDEKELLEIIRHSVKNPDVSGKEELEFTANLLILGEQKVSNFMTPIDKVALVKPDEQLTPKIMDELHQSRSSWFLVFRGNRQNVVGVLSATDAINLKSQKYIRDIMHSEVFYINEQQTITEALNIFLNTKQSILVVINQYKDVVGAILIEDVVKQIIAPMNLEQPNGYDDINVVANITAKNHTPNQS
jgi:Mg2+/Co2+ transporter CorB